MGWLIEGTDGPGQVRASACGAISRTRRPHRWARLAAARQAPAAPRAGPVGGVRPPTALRGREGAVAVLVGGGGADRATARAAPAGGAGGGRPEQRRPGRRGEVQAPAASRVGAGARCPTSFGPVPPRP